jgi:hypothetical protein
MTEAALQRDIDPERLSFTHAINVIRRKTIAQRVFSPTWFAPPTSAGAR